MNRLIWMVVVVVFSCFCFGLSYYFITQNKILIQSPVEVKDVPTTGSLAWYTSVPQRHAERLANAFKTFVGIDVRIVRGSTFIIRKRILSEANKGAIQADIVTIADLGTYLELRDKGLLAKLPSRKGVNPPKGIMDGEYWAAFAGFGICMAYDENHLDSPPSHWEDLLQRRWRGRIGLEDINTAGSQYGQYFILRELLGKAFWKRLLSEQKPRIYFNTESLADALLEGEIDIAGQFSIHIVYEYGIKRKTSIRGIYPEEGIPFIVNPVAMIQGTPHPTESEKFLDFLLSRKGQELMQRLCYKYALHGGVAPLQGIPSLRSLHILQPENITEYSTRRDQYIKEFNRFFQGKD